MDNEKYLEQLTQELQAKQEKEKDITAAVEYASNLLKLHLPVIFDRKHFEACMYCDGFNDKYQRHTPAEQIKQLDDGDKQ